MKDAILHDSVLYRKLVRWASSQHATIDTGASGHKAEGSTGSTHKLGLNLQALQSHTGVVRTPEASEPTRSELEMSAGIRMCGSRQAAAQPVFETCASDSTILRKVATSLQQIAELQGSGCRV